MQKICQIEKCSNKVVAKGYCNKHYLRLKKYGDPLFTKHKEICLVNGCENRHAYNGYCAKHNKRIERHNDALYMSRKEPLVGSLEERFNKSYKINKETGCWDWTRSLFKQGYAKIETNEKEKRVCLRAHRLSYSIYKGDIPKGMLVCHSCDNVKCVNPEHLWLGSHLDNINDCINKKRRATNYKWKIFGESHHGSKLTNIQVKDIKIRLNGGEMGKDLSKEFNVCKQTISLIKNNKRWKHIN
jgi:hypothetical protein